MCAKKVTEVAEVATNEVQKVEVVEVETGGSTEPYAVNESDNSKESPQNFVPKRTKTISSRLKDNPAISNIPKHILDLVTIVKDNAEIRRFTSLAILNYLYQKGEIKNKRGYVGFYWNKFSVKVNGLSREYWYSEKFFIKALVSSFTTFAAVANMTINTFLEKELNESADEVVTNEEAIEIAQQVLLNQSKDEKEDKA